MTVMVRLGRWCPKILASLIVVGGYRGWRWEVIVLLAAGLLVSGMRERWAPEILAGLLAAGAYWYGGWRWGVVGLMAAALLAWGIRAWRTGPSLSPAENGRG
jgi:hypothetical protein